MYKKIYVIIIRISFEIVDTKLIGIHLGGVVMKRIKTLAGKNLQQPIKSDGCGECQTSCQSACKTSCGVVNQSCEKEKGW